MAKPKLTQASAKWFELGYCPSARCNGRIAISDASKPNRMIGQCNKCNQIFEKKTSWYGESTVNWVHGVKRWFGGYEGGRTHVPIQPITPKRQTPQLTLPESQVQQNLEQQLWEPGSKAFWLDPELWDRTPYVNGRYEPCWMHIPPPPKPKKTKRVKRKKQVQEAIPVVRRARVIWVQNSDYVWRRSTKCQRCHEHYCFCHVPEFVDQSVRSPHDDNRRCLGCGDLHTPGYHASGFDKRYEVTAQYMNQIIKWHGPQPKILPWLTGKDRTQWDDLHKRWVECWEEQHDLAYRTKEVTVEEDVEVEENAIPVSHVVAGMGVLALGLLHMLKGDTATPSAMV